MVMESKICTVCGEEKPISEFYRKTITLYHGSCKSCYSIKAHNYYERRKAKGLIGATGELIDYFQLGPLICF